MVLMLEYVESKHHHHYFPIVDGKVLLKIQNSLEYGIFVVLEIEIFSGHVLFLSLVLFFLFLYGPLPLTE